MARGGGLRAQKGDVHCAAWPSDLHKCLFRLGKTSICRKPLFCIQRWLGSCLETSGGRLVATPKGPGKESPRIGPHRNAADAKNPVCSVLGQNETPMVPERVAQGYLFFIRVQMARGGGFRPQKGGCSLRSFAHRPSQMLVWPKENKHFSKTALFHPKMVEIVS